MIALLLSILSSSTLMVIFKYFTKYNVNNFQAITVNYFVAAALGFSLSPISFSAEKILISSWLPSAIIIGCIFISMFYLMAISSQKVGVAITSVANKMSLAIPVIAGVVLYQESLAGLKLVGVVGAVVSVALVTYPKAGIKANKKHLILPVIIFLGSGFLDTFFKYVETYQIHPTEIALFSASLFLVAFITGLTILVFNYFRKSVKIDSRSIVGGIFLGIPNYFSIHFLLIALNLPHLESTVVFPLNNTGIVVLSTILAIILFSEKLSKLNWAGIVLALASIILIAAI